MMGEGNHRLMILPHHHHLHKNTRCIHGLGKIYTSHTISQSWASFPWSPFSCKNTYVVEASDPQRERPSHPFSCSNIRWGETHFLATRILTPPPIDGRPLYSMSQSLKGTLYPLSDQSHEVTEEFRHPLPIRTHPPIWSIPDTIQH